jgi:putative endonuclease
MERNKYYVYVLCSQKDRRLYTGYTSDIGKRLRDHNAGNTKSLRNRRPLKLVYYEEFNTKTEAIARESYFKTPEGGAQKKKLIEQASDHFSPRGEIP